MNKAVDKISNTIKNIKSSNCYMILLYVIAIIFIIVLSYSIYLYKQLTKGDTQKSKMIKQATDSDINLTMLTTSDYSKTTAEGLSYALTDYHVFGSYNSCCVGDVVNGTVSLDALDTVINYGVRFLDFEIYFKNNKVVVAAGRNNPYIKDTFNELDIGSVLSRVKSKALGEVANSSDPLILNFRIVSNNTNIYDILAKKIMQNFRNNLMNRVYGQEGEYNERSVFTVPFKKLRNKVLIFVDDPNKNFMDNQKFYELVNGSTSKEIAKYSNYEIISQNSPSYYKDLSKEKYIITMPNPLENTNSEAMRHKSYGCQAILMNFGGGYNNDSMKNYKQMFNSQQRAFILKSPQLLRQRVVNRPPRPVDENTAVAMYWCSGPGEPGWRSMSKETYETEPWSINCNPYGETGTSSGAGTDTTVAGSSGSSGSSGTSGSLGSSGSSGTTSSAGSTSGPVFTYNLETAAKFRSGTTGNPMFSASSSYQAERRYLRNNCFDNQSPPQPKNPELDINLGQNRNVKCKNIRL